MTRCTWWLCRLVVCALLGCCLAATAQAAPAAGAAGSDDKPQSKGQAQAPDMEQMMAEMKKYSTPGPEHAILKGFEGSWKTLTKAWMGPGEPTVSEGTAVVSSILGGRFLKEEFTSTFMGEPFQGLGLTGYDLVKKEYIGSWVDSMGTSMMMSHGRYDAAAKQYDWTATYFDPMTKTEKTTRMVGKVIDANKHTFAFYETADGKEVMTMEITYTRK